MQMECNAWSYYIKNVTPNPKISQNTHQFQNPKNFKKLQNLCLNVWNAWRKRDKETIPEEKNSNKAEIQEVKMKRERKECFGEVG